MKKELLIGITDTGKYKNYADWFEQIPEIKTIKLTWKEDKKFADCEKCDGIVLSGGEDVHPKFYNKPEYLKYIKEEDIIEDRDLFEFELIRQSIVLKKPILGICRGLQVANVFFGGTLIPDIPSFGKPNHSSTPSGDKKHNTEIRDNTILKEIIGRKQGETNSAHHQSADQIADLLKVSAVSSADSIVEALEWKDSKNKPFLLLVQWHPERMLDQQSPFSKNIRDCFLNEIRNPS